MSSRMDKVNKLLRQELSRLIHEKIGGQAGFITVTDVETTSDLQLATAHVSVIEGEGEQAREKLQNSSQYFQNELAKAVRMRFIPKLTFMINDEARRERVEKLLEELP